MWRAAGLFRHFHCNRIVTSCPPFAARLWRSRRDGFKCSFSFFPQPRLFFLSAVAWSLAAVFFWFLGGEQLGAVSVPRRLPQTCRLSWAYQFSGPARLYGSISIFNYLLLRSSCFWRTYSPHPWQDWSILGSVLILFSTYIPVQLYVALNNWRGPFFDLFQKAITTAGSVDEGELYTLFWVYAWIGMTNITLFVLTRFA